MIIRIQFVALSLYNGKERAQYLIVFSIYSSHLSVLSQLPLWEKCNVKYVFVTNVFVCIVHIFHLLLFLS